MSALVVKSVVSPQEFQDVQALHRQIWGLTDLEVIPGHILQAVQHANGVILCAYEDDLPVGFSFAFCGLREDGMTYLHSHNLGVLEAYRGADIGYRIKHMQRAIALERSLDLIQWTFDPLESRNANMNLIKLGCVCTQYVRDYYGQMQDRLNENMPSDRLVAEWWIRTPQVAERVSSSPITEAFESDQFINPVQFDDRGLLKPQGERVDLSLFQKQGFDRIYVEIPSNYQKMRKEAMPLARKWRFALRDVLEECFARGLWITDFVYTQGRAYYVLRDRGLNHELA